MVFRYPLVRYMPAYWEVADWLPSLSLSECFLNGSVSVLVFDAAA